MQTMIFIYRLFRIAFENERAVGPSEAEGIGQRVVDSHGARLVGNIVQVTLGIGCLVIDGGRGHLIAYGQHRDAGLEAARAAQQMPGHGLGGADRQPAGVLSEAAFNGRRLGAIAQLVPGLAPVAAPVVETPSPGLDVLDAEQALAQVGGDMAVLAELIALFRSEVPRALVGRREAGQVIPRRLVPVFRDRNELASAADLAHEIREALAVSRTLIVICSRYSAVSKWVEQEIRTFKGLGRKDRVFPLIIDGEPNAVESARHESEECFAPSLRFDFTADGAPTKPIRAGWARVNPATGREEFPRIDPAVICLVHDGGDRAVLARQTVWPQRMFSLLAGFVEAGESVEPCVVR